MKIGRSGNVMKRLKDLKRDTRLHLELTAKFEGAGHREKEVHQLFRVNKQMFGEWFDVVPQEAIQCITQLLGQAPVH